MNHEPANLDFESGSQQDGRPRHWGGGGEGYEFLVDSAVSRAGRASGCVRSVGQPGPQGFGTLTQCFGADRFHGARVRYSGFLKTADVRGWAGLWMRVDGSAGSLRFDNMATPVDRSVAGTTDWTQYEIVLDVPPEATGICLGFLLSGTGTVWGDDLLLEILDASHEASPGPSDAMAGTPSLPRGLLPAWASTLYADLPGGTAGMAGQIRGGSVAPDLFFGRDDEQRQFRELLAELARTPKKAAADWSRVVIVNGIGGIGKSTLAERFSRVASEGEYRAKYTIVKVDWANFRQDPAFAAQPGPSFEAVLEKLEQECSRTGTLARYFSQFRRLCFRIAQVSADVDRMGGGPAESGQPDTALGRSAKMIGSAIQAGEAFGVPPGLGEAAQAAGVAADALSVLWKGGESWLRGRLDPEDYQLFVHPQDVLASAFAKGLAAAAARRPIVLLADTCEIVAATGPWLRAVMRDCGPRVAWVLCGRFEADRASWPGGFDLYDGYVPSGRLSELNAYRKDVPGSRLRLFELGAFDAETLRTYLSKAAPERPVDNTQLDRLLAATAGIPLAVRLAASLWRRGIAIERITDPVPISADRRTIVEGMTERFFFHLTGNSTSDSDRDKIYGLALILYPDDADLVAALWATDHVVESFESLAQRHDFVLTGQFRLHDTVHAFLLRYLLDPFHRRQVRPLNQRAVALLEQRLGTHHQHLTSLQQRMRDEQWIKDLLALVWHRFWVRNQDGWATLLAAFPAAIAYNPGVGRALLDLARRFVPSAAANEHRRLRLLRDTVGPIAALFDRVGADSLSDMSEGRNHRTSVEPDAGCSDERTAILEWLNGQHTLHNGDLPAALRHLTAAADLAPPSTGTLRRWISRGLLTLSRRLPSEPPTSRQDPETAPYAAAARLAVQLEPDNADAQRQWGRVLHHLGRNEDALNAFDTAIELSDHSTDAHIDRGEILRILGRYEEALKAADRAISLDPENARAIGSRGETYSRMKRYNEAMTDLNDAINRDHELAWAFVSRGVIYLTRRDNEKALADFEQAIGLDHESSTAFVARGQAYYMMGRLDEALADFSRAIDLDPGDTGAVTNRGQIYRAMRRYEEALADLDRVLSLEPERLSAMAARGEIYHQVGRYEEAIDDFSRAIDLDPGNASALAVRGETYRMMGRHEEALADFSRAIGIDPSYAWAIASRGQTYQAMGRFEEALADLNVALSIDPQLNWATTERGDTYRMMGRFEEALSDCSHVIDLGGEISEVMALRGMVYRDMQRFEEALADFNCVIELDADHRYVASRGWAYCKMGRHEEALADLNVAVEFYPDLDWAIAVRGKNYLQMGRYAEAFADLSRAARLDPENAWPQFELAIVYLRLGQRDPAHAALGRAIKIGTEEIASRGVTLPRLFDLALCHAALGNVEQAKALWVQALVLPHAATYARCIGVADLRDLQTVMSDSNQVDELLRLLATSGSGG